MRGERRNVVLGVVIGVLSLCVVGGCGESRGELAPPPAPVEPTREHVERWLPKIDEALRGHVEAALLADALEETLARRARRAWARRVDGGIKYADLFERVYRERKYRPVFAYSDGLNGRGREVLEVLRTAGEHALDPEDYHVSRVEGLDVALREARGEGPAWHPVRLDGGQAERLVDWTRGGGLDLGTEEGRGAVIEALVGEEVEVGGESPLPEVTEMVAAFMEASEEAASTQAELELRVVDGALRYARDMRHFNLSRQDWRDLRDAGGSTALIYGRLEETFDELAGVEPGRVRALFEALEPQHPQYRRLLGVLGRYREIEAAGGWPRARRVRLELGVESPRVASLRERLRAEGYLEEGGGVNAADESAAKTEVVDEALLAAMKAYRRTHQFEEEGRASAGVWRSLNVGVARRIEQIELSMQRWRESHYEGEPDFIMVNIPDFHAEVFKDGERQMRFRVVTGKNNRVCDEETGEWRYPNATPIQMATLDHLIINPYWYVPARIIEEELDPKVEADPGYFEEKNYERVMIGGRETIRQKPGEGNALGRVKFIFPNPANTYMHDTPHKKYFEYPVRAFSHGCVRVHQPLEFARYLLANDRAGEGYDVDALVEEGKQKYIELEKKLPVFLEYYTVRVDDEGHANFLADVYREDEKRLAEDPQGVARCRGRDEVAGDAGVIEPRGLENDLGP